MKTKGQKSLLKSNIWDLAEIQVAIKAQGKISYTFRRLEKGETVKEDGWYARLYGNRLGMMLFKSLTPAFSDFEVLLDERNTKILVGKQVYQIGVEKA